jgi:hypothetical protein
MKAGSATSGLCLCEKGRECEKQDLDRQGHLRSSDFFVGNTLRIGWPGL